MENDSHRKQIKLKPQLYCLFVSHLMDRKRVATNVFEGFTFDYEKFLSKFQSSSSGLGANSAKVSRRMLKNQKSSQIEKHFTFFLSCLVFFSLLYFFRVRKN